jgi:hypothetical protein
MVSAAYSTAEMLKGVANGDPLVFDKDTDVGTLNPGGGENFFNTLLPHLQKMICYCYGLPPTILDDAQSALGGTATLSNTHLSILDSQIKGTVDIARQELLEKIVRPLTIANFGADKLANLGEWQLSNSPDPTTSGIQVSNLLQGLMQGILQTTDFEAVNRYKELCGLSVQTREEYDREQQAKYELEQSS